MGGMSVWHWVIVAVVILLLFGRGRISEMMGDLGKGVNSFKKGLSEEDTAKRDPLLGPPPRKDERIVDPVETKRETEDTPR